MCFVNLIHNCESCQGVGCKPIHFTPLQEQQRKILMYWGFASIRANPLDYNVCLDFAN